MTAEAETYNSGAAGKFRDAVRIQEAITASLERKVLSWLAARTPARISPDHLTALGFLAQFLAGVCYALSRWNSVGLIGAVIFIGLNWLGDSLDGTLARYRMRLRPRYGFYVDHMIDSFGAAFLMTGLAVSSYLHWQVAAAMLTAFLLLSIETYLTAYTLSDFSLSHGFFGPTEIRILLATGTVALLFSPCVHMFGRSLLLFDIGGVVAAIGMAAITLFAAIRHTRRLYDEERLRTF
ncbi:MAG: CDP-alcohol phosphatidyltransferase family protein [Candidatus Acidiferrales bacterium]